MSGARLLGRYVVGERLGTGGLGEVYLAHVEGARGFRKRVVVKQVRSELAARPEVAALLLAEAEVVQRLAHGNIVQVLDVGVDAATPYLVMEHVDGVSLAELLADLRQQHAPLGLAAALFVAESVCAALAHAHAARDADDRPLGLVHRDITPGNILVSRDGVVKLTDFGIASLSAAADARPGTGTPGYAAPEQLAGATVDARADIHGLGVVFAELLARCPAPPPELVAIAVKASAPAPAQRFADASSLAAALETWRASQRILHEPAELAARVRDLQRRRSQVADQLGAALDHRARTARTAALPDRAPRRSPRRWLVAGAGTVLLTAGIFVATRDRGDDAATELATSTPVIPAIEPTPAAPPTSATKSVPEVPATSARTTVPDAALDARKKPSKPRPPAPGRLRVNLVPWAEASVDGRALGRTPITVELTPGRHRLVLVNPELGQRRDREVVIAGGADTRIVDW